MNQPSIIVLYVRVRAPSNTSNLSFVWVTLENIISESVSLLPRRLLLHQRSAMPPATTKPPSLEEWEAHKSTLQRLRHEGTKLEDIMKHMESKYKFVAS